MVLCCFKLPKHAFNPHPATRARGPSPEPSFRPLLPNGPRRQLTSGGDEPATVSPDPQLQSDFISRIPVELRLICWEYALGSDPEGDVLHLESVDGILRHCRCFEKDKTKFSFRHICWNSVWKKKDLDGGAWYSEEPNLNRRKLRSLILTCKLL